jgi:hypothetical protein
MPDPAFPPFIKDDIVRSYDLESTWQIVNKWLL